MNSNKHFFFIALIFALLAITSYFKYDMENGWYWLIPFALAVLAVIFILLSAKSGEKSRELNATSIITCPICGHKEKENMQDNVCEYFYECKNCRIKLKPKEGDCCVYCSYGSEECPPVQDRKLSNTNFERE